MKNGITVWINDYNLRLFAEKYTFAPRVVWVDNFLENPTHCISNIGVNEIVQNIKL